MARERKKVHKDFKMTDGKHLPSSTNLLDEYDIQTAEDIQDALKDLLGGTIKEMMEAEMDDHLGYSKSQRSESDYRNGYKSKCVNSNLWLHGNRCSTRTVVLLFEPQIVKETSEKTFQTLTRK